MKSEQFFPYVKSEQQFFSLCEIRAAVFSLCEIRPVFSLWEIRAVFSLCEIRAGSPEKESVDLRWTTSLDLVVAVPATLTAEHWNQAESPIEALVTCSVERPPTVSILK